MTAMAAVPGLSSATLLRLLAFTPPMGSPPALESALPPLDTVVFSSAPLRALADRASAGLWQLWALIPALEQAVRAGTTSPLVALARAAGSAARQVGEGHAALVAEGPVRVAAAITETSGGAGEINASLRTIARQIGAIAGSGHGRPASESLRAMARQVGALLDPARSFPAEPDADPIQRWLAGAQLALGEAAQALERAAQASQPGQVLAELAAAQSQVALAGESVGRTRSMMVSRGRAAPLPRVKSGAAASVSLLGLLVVGAMVVMLIGAGVAAAGLAAVLCFGIWVWRWSRASRHIALDAAS
ncbi:MAG: hypothetical protein RQ966_12765 [Acetobacteraceae bacterium]|nr:hypothetical protein [Acetobacteraceae bacterium]